ncbi:acetyltransferase EpsM [Catalinimonas alkaloidigena]|uniref:Acetyltransferase EpsM n=1 Tax=Catalinimonas alkaloidigena TaxID=1075417 RepID=A0A1G8ZLT2_9BACT|nr:acetyltransferase [Catalinimonas alkaloidigena]SDK15355.1 acetyltransferase EpsM [Catalinimonas alkaloidigena]
MERAQKSIALVGYSGHAYVVINTFQQAQRQVAAYCERGKKEKNPYALAYLGQETDEATLLLLKQYDYFVAIGDNRLRKKITEHLEEHLGKAAIAHHPNAIVAPHLEIGPGTLIGAGAVLNPACSLGRGVICNTCCIIEHECKIGNFAHIAPGAILTGNVSVGECAVVGAGATILPGLTIGRYAIVGAGATVTRHVPEGAVVVGTPATALST